MATEPLQMNPSRRPNASFSRAKLLAGIGFAAIFLGGLLFVSSVSLGPSTVNLVSRTITRHYQQSAGGRFEDVHEGNVLDFMIGQKLVEFPGWIAKGTAVLDSRDLPDWRERPDVHRYLDTTGFQPGRETAYLYKTHIFRIPGFVETRFAKEVWSVEYVHTLLVVVADGKVERYCFFSTIPY